MPRRFNGMSGVTQTVNWTDLDRNGTISRRGRQTSRSNEVGPAHRQLRSGDGPPRPGSPRGAYKLGSYRRGSCSTS